MDGEPSPEPPKNKILVLFQGDDELDQNGLISQLFNAEIGQGDRILKDLVWKTKYYEVCYDLYIDQYVDWNEWLREFTDEEYADLREVLAGLVVVSKYNPELELSSCGLKDAFVIWVNYDSTVGQNALDEVNDALLVQNQEVTVEVVNLHCEKATNDYSEKIGLERFKEIVDTCGWKNCCMRLQKHNAAVPNSELSLEQVMQKMQHARLRHQSSDLDDHEAMQIAEELANELVKGEQNDS